MDGLGELWQTLTGDYYTFVVVAIGAGVLGIVSGALGCFAVLRKQSLLGDAISHAALPGIALAYLLTGSKSSLILILGAGIAGWVATLAVMGILRGSRVKEDAALGLVLSAFFGLGQMLLTYIQSHPQAAGRASGQTSSEGPAGLNKFLFGQAATLLIEDIVTMAVLGGLALIVLILCWKQFKLVAFDPEFAVTLGLPVRLLDILITLLLVLAIVVGLQTVGVVLMSALVVAPAAAARQWTNRLGIMVVLAALFGAAAGVAGGLISCTTNRLPTGPTIVLCISGLVFFSLALAPQRGLVWQAIRHWHNRRQLRVDAVFGDLFELAQHHDHDHAHSQAVLQAMTPGHNVRRSLRELERRGWAQNIATGWLLTAEGRAEAQRRQEEGLP